jgi:hypothetical protein
MKREVAHLLRLMLNLPLHDEEPVGVEEGAGA